MPTRKRKERQHEAKLAALRAAIDEGDANGIAKGNAFDRVRKALKLRTKRLAAVPFRFARRAEAEMLSALPRPGRE